MTEALVKAAIDGGALLLVSMLLIRVFGEKLDVLTAEIARLHGKLSVLLDRNGVAPTTPPKMEKIR